MIPSHMNDRISIYSFPSLSLIVYTPIPQRIVNIFPSVEGSKVTYGLNKSAFWTQPLQPNELLLTPVIQKSKKASVSYYICQGRE